MTEWRDAPLGDVLAVKHGFAFKGQHFRDAGSDVLLTPKNFRAEGGLDVSSDRCKYYEGPVDPRFVLDPGDVVVAMTDLKQDAPILGAAGVVPPDRRYLHNQRIGKVVILDPDRLESAFVPWLLNSPAVRARIRETATGATVRHTAPVRIAEARVLLPSPRTQRRIAAVLAAFEELIAVNQRRIELLEGLARSLYREWFERFRFPGHEDAELTKSPLGHIPSGWCVSRLGDVARLVMGQSPKSEFYNRDGRGLPFHQGVTNYGRLIPTHTTFSTQGSRVAEIDDVLCSVRPPVGRVNLADQRLILGRGLASIRRHDDNIALTLEQVRTALGPEDSIGGGTIYKAVDKDELGGLQVLEPAPAVARRFEDFARPMLDLRVLLTHANRQLAATRDLLLPRLVTGRLDISDLDLGALLPQEDA